MLQRFILQLECQTLESHPNGYLQERDVPLRHKTQFTAVIVLAEHGVGFESVIAEEFCSNYLYGATLGYAMELLHRFVFDSKGVAIKKEARWTEHSGKKADWIFAKQFHLF